MGQFETELRRERQMEGIANAKAKGVYKGRKRQVVPADVMALRDQGMGASAVARHDLAHQSEAILRVRVMALIALYASAAKRARAEKHPRMRELRWAHVALIETRLIVTAETLFERPMQDFEAVVCAHHGTLH